MSFKTKLSLRIKQELKNLFYEFLARIQPIQKSVKNQVTYVCQFAIPESAEPSLTKKLKSVDDPNWANTGALSPERYAQWAFTMCGMASTLMALKHFGLDPALRVAELAEEALLNNVYLQEPTEISNMRYREFASWIKHYGLRADVYTRLSTRGIQYALSQGKLVIVSVNPNIRGYQTAPKKQKGGHLVLVTGYGTNTLAINNPSGFVSTNTQINHTLHKKAFQEYYAGRGIVLSKC